MMLNSAQSGEGGVALPLPFTITSTIVAYSPADRADAFLLFLLYLFSSVRLMIASVGEFLDCVEGKHGNTSCISSA
jgi:hypothetical protein